jgi:peptide/nickel transport system permease protein
LAPIIVISTANFASAILIEAGLSFLGLGVPPPTPTWGNMIRENYSAIFYDSSYLAIFPGLAILLLVMLFMFFGKGLREALNVRSY